MFHFISFGLLVLSASSLAQESFFGSCSDHDVNITQNFDGERYLGIWYEIERYESIYLFGSECVVSNYSAKTNTSVKVDITYKIGSSNKSLEGEAWMVDPEKNEGKIKMLTPLAPAAVHNIIGTDYDNYSVVWFCSDLLFNNMQLLWILSRKPELSEEARAEVDRILNDADLNKSRLRKTNNDPVYCGYE